MDDEEEEGNGVDESAPPKKKVKSEQAVAERRVNLKNPAVDTSFLPDREREEQDRMAREGLRQEWLKKQEVMKGEMIEIVYSYWDGSGHRNSVNVSCHGDQY